MFFATIGVLSTVAYLLLFTALRGVLGPQGANLVVLLVTAVGNTAANRRFTFGVRGVAGAAGHMLIQIPGLRLRRAALRLRRRLGVMVSDSFWSLE